MLFKFFLQLTNFSADDSVCGRLRRTAKEGRGWKGAETDSVLAPASVGTFRQNIFDSLGEEAFTLFFCFRNFACSFYIAFAAVQGTYHQIWIFLLE